MEKKKEITNRDSISSVVSIMPGAEKIMIKFFGPPATGASLVFIFATIESVAALTGKLGMLPQLLKELNSR